MKEEKVNEYLALKEELMALEQELAEVNKEPLEDAIIVEVGYHYRRTLSSSKHTNAIIRLQLKEALTKRITDIKHKLDKL